ncbi:hypothetical protein Tco_0212455 [Tanacetum coccineum]
MAVIRRLWFKPCKMKIHALIGLEVMGISTAQLSLWFSLSSGSTQLKLRDGYSAEGFEDRTNPTHVFIERRLLNRLKASTNGWYDTSQQVPVGQQFLSRVRRIQRYSHAIRQTYPTCSIKICSRTLTGIWTWILGLVDTLNGGSVENWMRSQGIPVDKIDSRNGWLPYVPLQRRIDLYSPMRILRDRSRFKKKSSEVSVSWRSIALAGHQRRKEDGNINYRG